MSVLNKGNSKIAHAHNHGHGNIGDDAMAENIYKKLRCIDQNLYTISTYSPPEIADPDRDVTSLSGICLNYDSIIKKCFLVFCHRFHLMWLRRLYILSACKVFYAGAILYKKTGIIIFLSNKTRSLLKVLSKIDLFVRSGSGSINDIWYDSSVIIQYYESLVCKLFGGKVIFTGQGLGPLSDWRWELVTRLSKMVDYMTFRDFDVSMSLLRAHGVAGRRYKSIGDDAFDIPATPIDRERPGIEKIGTNSRMICLQFRETDYENTYGDDFWSTVGRMLSSINSRTDNVFFVFLPMSHGRLDDVKVGEFIQSQYDGSNYTILTQNISANEAKGIISSSHLAIGQSYHFGVFALSSNVPFIGIYTNKYYKLKTEGLLRWYDREQWGLPADSIDRTADVAVEIFRDWDEHEANLRSTNSQIQKNLNHFYHKFLPRIAQGNPVEL